MSDSQGFYRLNKKVQQWIWKQNWPKLHLIQEQAIPLILKANCDVIISAATAAGKTEAAFLPACSRIADSSPKGIGILYISPLKALINDQQRRLQELGDILDMSVTSWHGDASRSKKKKQTKKPEGILLITPESLESLLLRHSGWCMQAFAELNYIIIDEFHSFIGTERGMQLQSLMRRLEFLVQRIIPRIALSATLGDMQKVANYLRPKQSFPCEIIESMAATSDLKIQLRGYVIPAHYEENKLSGLDALTEDLYQILRGKSNLIFANSREFTEQISANLSDRCVKNGVPNEFFPHHGNLSKEIRESLEARLQQERLPTSAVCTMTLELGIDIGCVNSIAQITAPTSVASLRQRLGRSGRRDEPAILRVFIFEKEISDKSHLVDKLRLETIQSIAMINLLLRKWYEPPESEQYHLSTLIQQTLSVIGQYGGVRAKQLWFLLCADGPFYLVDQIMYGKILKNMGNEHLISQTEDGQIILGYKGEKVIEHYSFYTAFKTPQEYRLECEGRVLGSVPLDNFLFVDQLIIFAGKRWKILHVNTEEKLVILEKALGGNPPIFHGNSQMVHDLVRHEMYRIYKNRELPIYLNQNAIKLFEQGMTCFQTMQLDDIKIFQNGTTIFLFPWKGDRITNTIMILLLNQNLTVSSSGGIIEITNCTLNNLKRTIITILNNPKPLPVVLASLVADTNIEKYDHYLPKELRDLNYGTKSFDIDGAWDWLILVLPKITPQ